MAHVKNTEGHQAPLGILEPGNMEKGSVVLTITLHCSDVADVRGYERAIPDAAVAAIARICTKFGIRGTSSSARWNPQVPLTSQDMSQKR